MEKKELDARLVQNLEDRYQYPLGVALVCLTTYLWLAERRRPRRQKNGSNRARGVS